MIRSKGNYSAALSLRQAPRAVWRKGIKSEYKSLILSGNWERCAQDLAIYFWVARIKFPARNNRATQEVDSFRRNQGGKSWSLRAAAAVVTFIEISWLTTRIRWYFLWCLDVDTRVLHWPACCVNVLFRSPDRGLPHEERKKKTINDDRLKKASPTVRFTRVTERARCHRRVERGCFR